MASNLWVAVGNGGTVGNSIVTSSDGNTWTSTGSTVIGPKAVAYKSNLWVAVGGGGNTIATSADGITWTGRGSTMFSGGNGDCVAWGNNLWVAAGYYAIASSPDGITWTNRSSAFSYSGGVAYGKDGSGNGLWVAVGSGYPGNTVATSRNGITWTCIDRNGFGWGAGFGVAYGNRLWVAVGAASGWSATIITSTDGTTWTIRSTLFSNGYGVAYGQDGSGNKLWVAVGSGGNTIATSPDGITWTGRGKTVFTTEGKSVTYANGLWVATGTGGNTIATSTDGINWTGKNNPLTSIGRGVVGPTKATLLTNYYFPTKKIGDASFNIIPPTSNNYGAITYTSSNTSVATIVGSKINVVGVGTSTITAVQEETFSYLSGTNTATFQVIQSTEGTETVLSDFSVPTKIIGDASFDIVVPTTNSDGAFIYTSSNIAVATIVGSTITIVGVGTSTISAIQLMTSTYASATISAPLLVNQITTVLSNFSVPTKTFGDVSFGIVAPTTNGNGTFSYASSNTTVVTISGDRITVVGGGSSTITATQASTTNYTSATITAPITVNQATTVLSNFSIGQKTITDMSFTIPSITTNSTGLFSYTSSDPTVATIAGNVATIVGIGSATITADQASNANYLAQTISTTLNVSRNLWVAVGYGTGNTVASSYDGIIWKGLGLNTTLSSPQSIAYSNNLWVAVGSGNNTLAYSTTNGNTWTGLGKTVFSNAGYRILYDPSAALWIATGQGGNSIATSTNPKTSWTGRETNFSPYVPVNCLYGPAIYSDTQNFSSYLLGGYSTGSLLAYSLDGTTWQMGTVTSTSLACQGFNTIAYGNGVYVAGCTPTGSGNSFATSTDQISWTGRGGSTKMSNVSQIAYGNGIFIAAGTKGTAGSSILKSTDGVTWTNLTDYFTNGARCVAYYQGRWFVGGVGTGIYYSNDNGTTWTIATASNLMYSNQTKSIAYGNGIVVSVGGQGTGNTLAISNNLGLSWGGNGLLLAGYGNDVKYNNGVWLAVGGDNVSTGNVIVKSTNNGTTWTQIATYNTSYFTSVSNLQTVNDMWYITGKGAYYLAYSNTNNPSSMSDFTMVSTSSVSFSTNGVCLSTFNYQKPRYIVGGQGMKGSVDGFSWFDILNQPFTTVNDVYWNGTIWVGVGSGIHTLGYSYDGINWIGIGSTIFTTSGNNVYYSTANSLWIATGAGTNTMATSVDGITWTGRGTTVFTIAGGRITYDNNLLVAVGEGLNKFATSTDGISWTVSTRLARGYHVTYINDVWFIIGYGQNYGQNIIATSTNGIFWKDVTIINTNPSTNSNLSSGYGIAYGNGKWVACGTDEYGKGNIMYSTNGTTWIGCAPFISNSTNFVITNNVLSVAYGNNLWVAVGTGGNTIATSTDGITWTGRGQTVFTSNGYNVAYANGLWVAGGYGGNSIATSVDGITWTGRGSTALMYGYSVVYGTDGSGNGLWVVGGSSSSYNIATSIDGITWTGRGNGGGGSNTMNDVAYGNGLWIACNSSGNNATSTDGITWTLRNNILPNTNYNLSSIAYANGLWVMTGYNSGIAMIATSTNGLNWTQINNQVFNVKGYEVVGPTSQVTKITTVLNNFSVPAKTVGDVSFSLVAPTSNSDGVITYTSSNIAVASIVDNVVTIVGGGTTTIRATQASTADYTIGVISATLTVTQITTVLTDFSVPTKTFGDASFGIIAPTTSRDGVFAYSSSNIMVATIGVTSNVITVVGAGSATITAVELATPDYAAATITAPFVVNQATPVMTNFSVPTKTFGDASFNIIPPVTNADGLITYTSSDTAVAAISGTKIIIVGGGSTTITANQAGTINFVPNSITTTFQVNQAIPTITNFVVPSKVTESVPFTLVAPTTNSSGAFTYESSDTSVATIDGSMVTIVGKGTSTITAVQASTTNYLSGSITATLIVRRTPVITDFSVAAKTFGDASFSIIPPITDSDGTLTYTSSNIAVATVGGGLLYVAMGKGGNTISTSIDGITWIGRGANVFTSNGYSVAFGRDSSGAALWVAVGQGGNTIATSTDGIAWTGRGSSVIPSYGRSVIYYNGLWVAFGTGGGSGNTIATSTDGTVWTGRGSTAFATYGMGVGYGKDNLGNNLLVAVGAGGNSIASSTDGIVWTGRGQSVFTTSGYGVAYGKDAAGNGLWVAVGDGSYTTATSTNGTTWTGRGSVFTTRGYGVAFGKDGSGNNLWVAVGQDGNSIATSTNGTTWTGLGTTIFTAYGTTVTYTDGLWVATGYGGNSVATSTNGTVWTGRGQTVFTTYGYGVTRGGIPFASDTVTIVGGGTTTITATQSLTANYVSGTITAPLVVNQATTVLTNFSVPTKIFGDGAFGIIAPTTNSNGVFTYTSSDTSVATIAGSSITIVGGGTATITATQASNTNFLSSSITATFQVNPATPIIPKFDIPVKTLGTAPFIIAPPTTNSNGILSYTSSNDAVASIDGSMVTINGLGTTIITAVQSSTANFISATTSGILAVMDKVPLSIAVGSSNYGNATIATSTDLGLTWTGQGATTFTTAGYGVAGPANYDVSTVSISLYTIIDSSGIISTSEDGNTWTARSSTGFNGKCVAYANNVWLAGGIGGLSYSLDGINWTKTNLTLPVHGLAYGSYGGNNFWTAVGGGGYSTSSDGITWGTVGTMGTSTNQTNDVANGNNIWISVGSGTSSDPVTTYVSQNSNSWGSSFLASQSFSVGRGIAYGNGRWVAVGDLGIIRGQYYDIYNTMMIGGNTGNWTPLGNLFTISGRGVAFGKDGSGAGFWVAVGEGTNTIATSPNGTTWTGRGSTIFTTRGTKVRYYNNLWFAFGEGGNTFATSTNGINWVGSNKIRGSDILYFSSTYTKPAYVAVGQGPNTIVGSTNGMTWTPPYNKPFFTAGYSIAWNGVQWMATGQGGNTIATSSDGIQWRGCDPAFFTSRDVYGVTYANSLWVACVSGSNPIATSTDGISWTGRGVSVFTRGNHVAYGQDGSGVGLWVAVGQGTNTIATSRDGLTWTGRGSSVVTTQTMGVAYANGLWVAVGQGGNTIATSVDGIVWTGRGSTIFNSQGSGVSYANNLWVAVGQGGNTIATSSDGIVWTGRGSTIFTTMGQDVTYANGLWVAGGEGTNTIATSTNGTVWIGRGQTIFTTRGNKVRYFNNLWIAVGEGTNTIATSTDGTTWTGRGSSVFTNGFSVAYGNGLWVAGGRNAIATSTDGMNWVGSSTALSLQGRHAVYGKDSSGNNLWVAVGQSGNTITTSTNGIVWTGRGQTVFTTIGYSVAYGQDGSGNALWVAVGQGGNTIATSINGTTWVGRGATVFTTQGYRVTYANNLWVAVGSGGNSIATSVDGITWTGFGTTVFTQGYGIRYTSNLWVAGGSGPNTIATSVNGINWIGRGTTIFNGAGIDILGPTAITPTLLFTIPLKNIGDEPFTLTPPTTNSTGLITYTSSNPSVATMDGTTVTIVGMGTSTITAVQASTDYFISGTIVANLVVENVKPTISNFVIPAKTFGDAVFTLIPPTSQSSGAFTYTSSNTAVATIAGNVVTVVGGGSATITASQASTANYGSTSITASLVVNPTTPVLTNFDIPVKTFGNAAFTITTPITNSTGGISYTSSNTAVATIVGSTITIVGAGSATITATQASTASYVSGTITSTFVVSKAAPTLSSFSVAAKIIGNTDFSLVAPTSNSTGAFTYTSSNAAVATITNNMVTIMGIGTSTITATQASTSNYASGTITASLAVNSPVWVMLGQGGNSIATSSDAITWTGRGSTVFTTNGYAVAYGNNLYVAVGQGTNTIATSADGITWTGRGSTIFTTQGWCVAYGKDGSNNGLWVAVGQGGNTVATSTDGLTWTGRGASVITSFGQGIAYANGLWVAVGNGGNTIATSTDGNTWTGRGATVITSIGQGIAYENNLWVAVGFSGGGGNTIATSTDGLTWTGRGASAITAGARAVAYANGLWVAGGNGGNTIATSTDGVTWTGRGATVFTGDGRGLAYGNGLWVAVGEGGNTLATSTDGITWTGRGSTIITTIGYDIIAPPKSLPKISNFSISPRAVGSADFTITAPTTNSDGTFTYTSSDTSVATVTGNTITIIGMGSTTITATQAVSNSYLSGSITTVFQVYGVGTYTQDNLNYTYNIGLGTAEVTGGTTAARDLSSLTVLPSFVVDGTTYTVTGVGYMAFNNWSNLTSISLPSSITTMAFSCFRGTSLTSFTIPPLVTTLEEFVLSIPTLTSITIPSTVTTFKYVFNGSSSTGPFVGCTSLANIVVNTYISGFQYVFYKVNNANMSVTFDYPGIIPPNCLESITNLNTVIIGNQITGIGGTAFGSCTGLTNVTIPLSVTTIGDSAFANCTNLNNVAIPLSVTTIGFNTFENCISFTNMTIPASVTSVGWYIFKNCTNLTNIIVKAYLTTLSYTFNNINSLNMSVTFDYAAFIPGYICTNVTNLKTVIISDLITGIEGYAFSGCTGLTELTIPASVTTIANFAFLGSSNLNLVTFFGNIPTIGTNNFTSTTDSAYYKLDETTNTNATTVATRLSMFANRLVIGAGSPTITNFSIPIKRYNESPFSIVDPSSNSNGTFSYSSDNPSVATVSGKTITVVAPGSTIITATQSVGYKNGVNYTTGTITTTFVVDNPPPQVGPLLITNKSLNDVSFSMVDPTKPENSTGTWTYASSDVTKATVSGNVVTLLDTGIVTITGTISSDSIYCSTKVTKLFSISPADVVPSTFTFVSTADVSNAIPVTVQPVANTVVLSPTVFTPEKIEMLNPSVGTVEEKIQNRNALVDTFFDLFSNATTISVPQTALYMPPTIDLANITEVKLLKTSGSTAQSPVVISSSAFNLTTAFYCAIDEVGNSILFNGTSTFVGYSVKISKVSDNNYTIVQTKHGVSTTFSAVKDDIIYYAGFKLVIGSIAGQLSTLQLVTLSNFSVPVKTLEDTSFSLVPPTTTSNGAFTYTSSDASVATVVGDVVTVVGLGTSTITAVQARTNTHLSDTITALFTVNKISTVLTNFSVPTKTIGDASFALIPPTSNSDVDGTFTYTSSNTAVATIVGNVVTIVGTGTSTITATQATTARYTSATTTATFTVNKVTTVLTNFSIPVKTFGNSAFAITAPTSNSNGSITYTSSNTAVATVAGSTITIVGSGTSTITASQATTASYTTGTITTTLQVNQVTTVLSNFSIPTKTYGNAAFTIIAPTSNSTGAITYTSSDLAVATIAGSVITIVGGGVSTITANQASTANNTSGTITAIFTVNKLTTTLSNFTVPANRLVGDIFTAAVPTSNRTGTYTYTSSNLAVATIDGNTITVVGGGNTIISAIQTTTSIYAAGTISATLTVNQITTVLSNFSVPAKKVGDAAFAITPPTTNGNGAFTYTSSNTAVATIVGNMITTVGVGNTTITASQASTASSTAGSITTTLQVTQGTLTLSNFSVPTKTILDASFSIVPPTTKSIGIITYTSSNTAVATIVGNTVTIVGLGSTTITASQATTVNYTSATITSLFHVIKATAVVSNFSIPERTIGNPTFLITPPASNSDGLITYTSSDTSVATIVGSRVTIRGPGTTTITAVQATTGIYTSASITAPFQVNLITTVLSNFVIPAKSFGDIPFKVQASSNSGAPITYTSSDLSVATVVGDIVTIVGAGSSTITASQDALNNFASATTTSVMQVSQITTVLTNFVVPNKTVGNASFAISPPSTNSNGLITYTSSNTAVATVDGNMVTIVGAGSSTITASQASTSNYTAETVTTNLQVNQAIPVLTNFAVPTKSFGSAAFSLVTPSTNSDGTFTYTSSNALVATVAGNVVTIIGAGNVTITATQSSTTNYISGIITAPFVVTKSSPTITNFTVPEKSFGSAAFSLVPPTTTGVGLITYTSSNTEVATIVRDVVTIVGIGSTTITATQASSVNFTSGTISATFTASKGTPTLANFAVAAKTIGDASFALVPPTTNGDGEITYTSSDLSVATIDGSTITIVGTGSSTITASQASTTNFLSGTTIALFTVNRIPTLLTNFSALAKTFGDASFALVPPSSNREGEFTYTSSNPAVATIEGDVVTIFGGGNTTITAVQASTASYRSGTISALLQVSPLKAVLSEFSIPAKIIGDPSFNLDPPTTISDGAFTYTSSNPDVATIEGNVVTILALGNTTITAVQASTANYISDSMNALLQVKLIRTVLSNFVIPTKTVGDAGFTLVPPTTNSDGNFTYTSSNLLVATVAGNVVTVVGTGNVTITALQESTFNSTPAIITASLVVNKATNSISWFSVPEKLFGNAPFTITPPTTNSNGAFTYTSSNPEVATILRNVVTIVGIGNTTITAVQANTVNYSAGTISATFTVTEGTPSLGNFSIPAKIVGDASFSIVPPTSKSNGLITYTSSNTSVATIDGDVITVVGVGSSTITATQASTESFISGTITSTLHVNKITTVTTNFVVPAKTFGDASFNLDPPTTNSNGLITYTSSNPAVATIDGTTVTIVGAGNATITAEQAITASYTSSTITGLLQVNKMRTVLTNFSVPAKNFGEAAFALVPPTTNSDGAFTYTSSNPEIVTIDGDIVTIVGLGSATIIAAQASTSNYTSDTIRALFQVNLITTVLTNFAVPSKKVGEEAFTITPPTSNTGGAFTYTSSNALVATVAGSTITIVGVGTATITASQASTQNSTAAIITTPFVVSKTTADVTNFSVPVKEFGNAAFTLVPPTTNSNGAFTYTSSNPEVATIVRNVVTIVGIGTSTITAVQASTANYTSGSITALLQVNQGTSVLTNFSVSAKTFGSAAFSLVPPSSNNNGAFTYTSSNPEVATIDGNMVTIIGAGSSTITANQSSTINYLSGTIQTTLVVNPITTVLTDFSVASKAVGNEAFALVPPTTNSDGAFTYTSSNLGVATIDGNTITILGGGISTITAFQASTTNYTSKTITATFQVSALTTVLSNFNMPTKAVGNTAFAIEPPTTNGDGAFTYTSSNTRIATIAGNMVTIVGAGTATISAIQASTPNYSSATITAMFIVNKGTAAITNFLMPIKEIGMGDFTILDPSSNSMGEFTYTSSNIKVATIFKNIVSIKGIGTSIITATQAMSANYIPGTTTTTFVVNQMSPTITGFTIPGTKIVGDKTFKITAAKSNSISAFTYTSSDINVAKIAKDVVTIVGAGTTVITGTQPATKSYGPGTVTATLQVNKKAIFLTNFSIAKKIVGTAPFAIVPPTTNSNGALTYTSSNQDVATITGNMVVLVGVGNTTITASQASTVNFTPGSISTQLVVNLPTPQVGTLEITNKSITNPSFTIVEPTKPENNTGTWTYTSSDVTKATISGNEVTLLQPGIVTITASLSSTNLYNSLILMTQFSISDQNVAPSVFSFIKSSEVISRIPVTVLPLLNTVIPATVSTPANNLKFNPVVGTVAEKQANQTMVVNTLWNMFPSAITISVPTTLLYVPLAFNKTKLKTTKLVRPSVTTTENAPLVINTVASDSSVAFLCSFDAYANGVQINGVGSFATSFVKIVKGLDNKYMVTRSSKNIATSVIMTNGDIISFVGITAMIGYL